MKYTPIIVTVPGDNSNELWLTPSEAKKLLERLQMRLAAWDDLVAQFGVREARKIISKRTTRRG